MIFGTNSIDLARVIFGHFVHLRCHFLNFGTHILSLKSVFLAGLQNRNDDFSEDSISKAERNMQCKTTSKGLLRLYGAVDWSIF